MKSRKANRLKGYDYSKDNLYFVTSCVKNMECCFGGVVPVRTGHDLSVHNAHNNPDNHSDNNPDNIPENKNQIEAKMILNKFGIIANNQLEWLQNQYPYIILHSHIVMPNHIHAVIEIDSSLLKTVPNLDEPNKIEKIKSLSQIMGAFKTTSSKLIHEAGKIDFAWHRSFHDHIIRDESAYLNIVNYIENNPNSWNKDKFYTT
jgi:REP element-mobilizing transposase RayT